MNLAAFNFSYGLIVDAVIVLILVVFAIVGLKKGLVKSAYGLVCSIAVLALAVVLASPVTQMIVDNTDAETKLVEKIETGIAAELPNSYANIVYYDFNGDGEFTSDELAFQDDEGNYQSFSTIFNGTPYQTIKLHELIRPFVVSALAEQDAVYLSVAVSQAVANLIIMAIVFVGLLIVLRLAFALLYFILHKMVQNIYVVHFLDKLVGFVFGIAVGAVVVLCVVTVCQMLFPFSFFTEVKTVFEQSTIGSLIVENNFVYDYIVKYINLEKLAK